MAAGSMQIVIGDFVRVSQATVSRLLPRVCMALIQHLPTIVKMPETVEERRAAAVAFREIAGFPRTIGAIDCTHVKIQSPGGRMVRFFFFFALYPIKNPFYLFRSFPE